MNPVICIHVDEGHAEDGHTHSFERKNPRKTEEDA